jgi:hypothetical protein
VNARSCLLQRGCRLHRAPGHSQAVDSRARSGAETDLPGGGEPGPPGAASLADRNGIDRIMRGSCQASVAIVPPIRREAPRRRWGCPASRRRCGRRRRDARRAAVRVRASTKNRDRDGSSRDERRDDHPRDSRAPARPSRPPPDLTTCRDTVGPCAFWPSHAPMLGPSGHDPRRGLVTRDRRATYHRRPGAQLSGRRASERSRRRLENRLSNSPRPSVIAAVGL